jgi:hypothetical protein
MARSQFPVASTYRGARMLLHGPGRGMMRRPGRGAGLRGMGSLGIVAPFASSFQPQITQISQQLQQTEAQIQANNQLIVQGNQAGLDMSAAAAQNLQAENDNETAINNFTLVYRALFGTVPPGLSGGLGQFDAVSLATAAGVAAALAELAVMAYSYYQESVAANTTAQAALENANTTATAGSNSTALANQAAAAYAAGNQSLGDQLSALASQQASVAASGVAPPPPPAPSALAFIEQNWPWLLGGGAVLWLASKL